MTSISNGHSAANGTQQKFKEEEKIGQKGLVTLKANSYAIAGVRNETELKLLAGYAVDYAHSIGLVGRSWDEQYKYANDVSVAPPLALFPSPFPKELYEQAVDAQQALNELYFRVACDHDFLMEAYKDVIKGDPFHAKLIDLAKRIKNEGIKQPLMVGLQRADYLSHWNAEAKKMELKQVEVNPGQIGGPGSATMVSKLHRKMLDKLEIEQGHKLPILAKAVMPENRPRHGIALTLYKAWKMFGDPNAMILYVNQPDLFPVCAFEQLQFVMFQVEKLAKQDGQRVLVRCLSIKQCGERLSLDERDRSLYLDGTKRVGLVHMAYGYLPEHFPNEKDYEARVMMERSTAIMSPNLRLQLAGTKKIQQVLSKPGVLEHFFPNEPQKVAKIRNTFMDLWGLEENDAITRDVIKKAIQNGSEFVMKSQMDGGHGIYFDDEIGQMLKKMTLEERGAFILMKKIEPVVAKNFMIRPFTAPHQEDVHSEMGIYGSLIGDQSTGKVIHNAVNGHLLRSKAASQNLGGVSTGGGVIDSVLLYPSSEFQ